MIKRSRYAADIYHNVKYEIEHNSTLSHYPLPLTSFKLLFRISEINGRLAFSMTDFHLPDHFINTDIPPWQEMG